MKMTFELSITLTHQEAKIHKFHPHPKTPQSLAMTTSNYTIFSIYFWSSLGENIIRGLFGLSQL